MIDEAFPSNSNIRKKEHGTVPHYILYMKNIANEQTKKSISIVFYDKIG